MTFGTFLLNDLYTVACLELRSAILLHEERVQHVVVANWTLLMTELSETYKLYNISRIKQFITMV